jgi:hypothetical protein
MGKSITVHQKKRGRPATGRDPAVTIRLSKDVLDAVEEWAARQDDSPARSPAIARLVELGLKAKPIPSERGRRGRSLDLGAMTKIEPVAKATRASRARELAAETIDQMIDPSAPPEERAQRRRRLTKGPEEFREVRVDRPKAKRR